MFSQTRKIEIEFGDCDPAGIVYFPNYHRFFDDATAHLVSAALGMKKRDWIAAHGILGISVVKTVTEFKAPCRYGDMVEIVSTVSHIGRTSFVIAHRLTNAGVLSISSEETRVWIGAEGDTLRPMAIPDDVRFKLGGSVA